MEASDRDEVTTPLATGEGMAPPVADEPAASPPEPPPAAELGAALLSSLPKLTDIPAPPEAPGQETSATSTQPAAPRAERLPFAAPGGRAASAKGRETEERWSRRVDTLVKEAKALGLVPAAAPLWFEAGRIFEEELGRLKEAATHYGEANRSDSTFLPVIHAARRLFTQLQKYPMVVYLLDAELALPDAPRAALLVEKGWLHETRLERADEALAFYRQALDVEPAYPPAVDHVLRHLAKGEDWAGSATVLHAAIGHSDQPIQKVSWLLSLARLYEGRLDDTGEALAVYEEAASLSEARSDVLLALARLYARAANDIRLAEVLGHLAARASTPAEAAQHLARQAALLLLRGEVAQATEALEQARAAMPSDTLVLSQLSRVYESAEQWEPLVGVLEAQALATSAVGEKVALYAEAGRLAEERLEDATRAASSYRACLEHDPTYSPALSNLGKLYARAGRWQELVDVFVVQIDATREDDIKVPWLFKLAELLHEKLGDHTGAIARLQEALALSPNYLPALKLISGLYARQGRWAELLEVYERELDEAGDRDQAMFLLERIAAVSESQLSNPDRAIAAYQRMLERHAGYLPALRSLGRLYAQTGRWEELIGVNQQEAELVGEKRLVVALMHRNGEILEEKLNRPDEAVAAYRAALALSPNYLPALRALGRIYATEQRWHDLIAMYREEAEVARTPWLRVQSLCTVAEFYEHKLGDLNAAADTYRETLSVLPTHLPALRALSRLAQQAGDFEGLVQSLVDKLPTLTDVREQGLLRCRIAELLDHHLGRPEDAIFAYEEAIQGSPSLLVAHEQVVALYVRLGRDDDEARARERLQDVVADAPGQAANLRALVDLYLHRLRDVGAARHTLDRLLAIEPTDRVALGAAIDAALRTKDHRAAIRHATELASLEPDPDDAAALYLQVATWKETYLEPPEDSLSAYLSVLEYAPLHPVALRAVERAYMERGAWEGLYRLYERERAGASVAARIADLSMKMGDIAERHLDDVADAAAQFEAALRAQPALLPAIARLKDCYARLNRAEDQLRMLAFEANASRDEEHALKTLLEVAQLQRDKFQNLEGALESLAQARARAPRDPRVLSELEPLLRETHRHAALSELWAEQAASTDLPLAERIDHLVRAAQLRVEKEGLEGTPWAIARFEEVLALDATHQTALTQVGNLCFALRRFERARDAYLALVKSASDQAVQGAAAFTLGVLYQDHLANPVGASEALEFTLRLQPNHREALLRYARVSVERGVMPAALQAHQQLLQLATSKAEQLQRHLAIAELYELGFREPARAAAAYERALEVAEDPEVRTQLLGKAAELHQRTGDLDSYLHVVAKHATTLAERDPRQAAELLLGNARLILEHKQDPRRAIAAIEEGLRYHPEHIELTALAAGLYAGTLGQPIKGLELHRRLLQRGAIRVDSIRTLRGMWSQMRQTDRAFLAADVLRLLRVANDEEELTYAQHKAGNPTESQRELGASQRTQWLVHPDQRTVIHEVLSLVAEELGKLEADDLSAYRIDKKDIFKAKSSEPLRRLTDSLATMLGGVSFDVYRTEARPHVATAHHAAVPALVVGSDLVRGYQTREQRFLLGRALMSIRCGHHLIRDQSPMEVAVLLSAIARAVDKNLPALRDHPDLDALTKRVGASLSRQARKALIEPVMRLAQEWRDLDLGGFLAAMGKTEARAGLVCCGSFSTAVRLHLKSRGTVLSDDPELVRTSLEADPVLQDLLVFALSEEHFRARQTLDLALPNG